LWGRIGGKEGEDGEVEGVMWWIDGEEWVQRKRTGILEIDEGVIISEWVEDGQSGADKIGWNDKSENTWNV
jgi:hypothetical protein